MVTDVLHSFIEVIDAGSFSKAAEKLYISSTALMKQMNGLEAQVGVQLLIRTHQGIQATDAGTSFYHDARFLIQYSEKAIARARQAANPHPHTIRIGTSLLNPPTALIEIWNTISDAYPQFNLRLVPLDATATSWPTVSQTPGKEFDVIVGAYECTQGPGAFQVLKLGEYRFGVAVSRTHPFARKERIALADLAGERLVMIQPGISPLVDAIREAVVAQHPDIEIKSAIQHYNMDVFNRCEASHAVLLTLDAWKDVHPSLVTLPVDWQYTLPYGILYPLKPASSVQVFVKALQETLPIEKVSNG